MKKTTPKTEVSPIKTDDATPIEQNPTPPIEPTVEPIAHKNRSLFPIIMLGFTAIILAIAFPNVQTLISQAAPKKCEPITKVMINPGSIEAYSNSKPIELSVLAYDRYNRPVREGVKYDWGISSTDGVGTVKARHDLAMFRPLKVGNGNLYVKTTNKCTPQAVIGSAKITIKQSVITPTIKKGR